MRTGCSGLLADWLPGDAVGATEAGDTGDEEAVMEQRGGAAADVAGGRLDGGGGAGRAAGGDAAGAVGALRYRYR